jgi:hypothetical protein
MTQREHEQQVDELLDALKFDADEHKEANLLELRMLFEDYRGRFDPEHMERTVDGLVDLIFMEPDVLIRNLMFRLVEEILMQDLQLQTMAHLLVEHAWEFEGESTYLAGVLLLLPLIGRRSYIEFARAHLDHPSEQIRLNAQYALKYLLRRHGASGGQ